MIQVIETRFAVLLETFLPCFDVNELLRFANPTLKNLDVSDAIKKLPIVLVWCALAKADFGSKLAQSLAPYDGTSFHEMEDGICVRLLLRRICNPSESVSAFLVELLSDNLVGCDFL